MSRPDDRLAERLPRPLTSAWILTRRTVTGTINDRVHGLAAEAAFFAILSLPPMLLAVVGSIGYIAGLLGPEATERVAEVVIGIPETFLAAETMETLRPMLEEVLVEGRAGIASFGFLIALWGGSRAINVYLETLAIAYRVEDPRPTWRRRVLAYALTVAGALVGALVIPALVMGPDLVALLAPGPLDTAAQTAARMVFWPSVILVTVLMLTALYHVGVPWETPFWRDIPGAALAMLLWLLGGVALRMYADMTLRGEETIYGPLATPLVVLLWLYVTSFAVLLGAEFNAEIERMWPHTDGPLKQMKRFLTGDQEPSTPEDGHGSEHVDGPDGADGAGERDGTAPTATSRQRAGS
jgi:membrane protein